LDREEGVSLPSGKLIENNENLKVPMLLCSLCIVLSKGVDEAFFGVGKHEFKMLKVSQKHIAVTSKFVGR